MGIITGQEPGPADTEASELVVVFPEDQEARVAPDRSDAHESIPPEGPPFGEVDPDQVIPRWQWG
jgi:hypothetical protein